MKDIILVEKNNGNDTIFLKQHIALLWRHNGRDSVSNHQPHDCLLNRLFGRRSKKISKLRVTGLCAENSPGTGDFPAQMASYAENVSIWWRHHGSLWQWHLTIMINGENRAAIGHDMNVINLQLCHWSQYRVCIDPILRMRITLFG